VLPFPLLVAAALHFERRAESWFDDAGRDAHKEHRLLGRCRVL
jgi:hypothetical protein